MLLGVMTTYRRGQWLVLAGFIVIAVSGCGGRGWREYLGLAASGDPSVNIRPAEPKWLLIKNPRCCDIPSEVYDEKGALLCYASGGFAGGDGRCPGFSTEGMTLLWQDPRGAATPPPR